MLELEARTGEWTVYIGERYGDFGFTAIDKVTTPDRVRWNATRDPLMHPYSNARKIAAEYAAHVIDVQDPEVRDRVFIGCPVTDDIIEITSP